MPVGKDSQQIAVVIPKEYLILLDEYAANEMRTRSKAAAKIIIEFLKEKKS